MWSVMKKLFTKVECWCLTGSLVFALVLAGGYFQPTAAVFCIVLGALLLVSLWKNGKIVFPNDRYAFIFALIPVLYLITAMWAVDSGMALTGFIHFLPVLLFYVLLCRNMNQKQMMIESLPLLGSLMTLFSFLMMQFPVFQKYVCVAGRLAGFFQYPNTYALFMLICLIIVVYRMQENKLDWLDIACGAASIFGIYMSGSRTTAVLLFLVFIFFFFKSRKLRKILIPMALILLAAVAALGMLGITENLVGRLFDLSLRSSTFLGRLLYAQDAVKIILQHPFGIGYYGYYFLQPEIQTGVYSVVNVHNELLQLMLDIGIIPSILFYGCLIMDVVRKNIPERNRLVILVIVLHSLLDYDLQFLSIWFVLMLFLDLKEGKEYRISMLTKSVSVLVFAGVMMAAASIGISDYFTRTGDYEKAIQAYDGNTMAKTYQLTELEDTKELKDMAVSILERNRHVPLAYHALAQTELAEGRIETYLRYKERAMQLAPYDINAYMEYLDALDYCINLYIKNEELESAKICLEKAQKVPEILETVKEKTSWLGWQINDKPQVVIPWEYEELLDKMEQDYQKAI